MLPRCFFPPPHSASSSLQSSPKLDVVLFYLLLRFPTPSEKEPSTKEKKIRYAPFAHPRNPNTGIEAFTAATLFLF